MGRRSSRMRASATAARRRPASATSRTSWRRAATTSGAARRGRAAVTARSGPGGAPAGGGRLGLVEPRPDDREQLGVLGLAVGAGLLERGHSLGGHLARVLGLDPGQPLGALGRLPRVDVDALVRRVLVDLVEEDVDELLLGYLAQRLAAGEDQALVLGPGDA